VRRAELAECRQRTATREGASREHNKPALPRRKPVIVAAILRHLHAVITTGQAWDPAIATQGIRRPFQAAAAAS
jgi:hypothetical protein